MIGNGFINKKNNDYYSKELGIIVEDLHDENVLTNNGILFFVETGFYLTKEFNESQILINGNRNLHPLRFCTG